MAKAGHAAVGQLMADVTVAQAAFRDLSPQEERADLLNKCKRGLAKKGFTPSPAMESLLAL